MTQQYKWLSTVAQMKLLAAELIRAAESMGGDDEESHDIELVLAVAPAGTVQDDDGVWNAKPILTVRLDEYPEEGVYPVDPYDPTGGRVDDPTPPASAQDDAKDERQAGACPRCDGSGEITVMSDNSPDAHDVDVCCDHCQGSGAAVDAAKFLAAALSGEKYRHMQLWAEYRNFHRSLCARFGYGHDEIHFRRDLVSLEEAIASKVAAPAAGDARLPPLNIEAAAKAMAECMDYPWAHMPEQGRATMREHAQTVIRAASQQQEG